MLKILPSTKWGWVRAGMLFAAAAGVLFWLYGLPWLRVARYEPQEGDVVFQSLPHVDLVDAIEGISGSPYSHCGLVVREGVEWKVLESIGSVHETPLYQWAQRGRASGFAAYRLTEDRRSKVPAFIAEARKFLGRAYDFRYRMDDEFIYCSELVWKAWKNATGEEMGKLVKLGSLNWKPHEATIRKYEQMMRPAEPEPSYGDYDGLERLAKEPDLPVERMMITPKALSEAPQLREVYRSGI